jgi:hypothetical protein
MGRRRARFKKCIVLILVYLGSYVGLRLTGTVTSSEGTSHPIQVGWKSPARAGGAYQEVALTPRVLGASRNAPRWARIAIAIAFSPLMVAEELHSEVPLPWNTTTGSRPGAATFVLHLDSNVLRFSVTRLDHDLLLSEGGPASKGSTVGPMWAPANKDLVLTAQGRDGELQRSFSIAPNSNADIRVWLK